MHKLRRVIFVDIFSWLLLYRLFPELQPFRCDGLLSVVRVMARRKQAGTLRPLAPALSGEDADFLKKNTNYSEEDIKLWFRSLTSDDVNLIF